MKWKTISAALQCFHWVYNTQSHDDNQPPITVQAEVFTANKKLLKRTEPRTVECFALEVGLLRDIYIYMYK